MSRPVLLSRHLVSSLIGYQDDGVLNYSFKNSFLLMEATWILVLPSGFFHAASSLPAPCDRQSLSVGGVGASPAFGRRFRAATVGEAVDRGLCSAGWPACCAAAAASALQSAGLKKKKNSSADFSEWRKFTFKAGKTPNQPNIYRDIIGQKHDFTDLKCLLWPNDLPVL